MIKISLGRWRGTYCCYLILGLLPLVHARWPGRQLEAFFPGWDYYLHDTDCASSRKADLDAGKIDAYYHAIECLFEAFPEYRKSEMAASAVALGLLPAILSLLGPSITDQAVLAMRRPALAFLLSASSPAVNPQLGGEYVALIQRKFSPAADAGSTRSRSVVWWEGILLVSLIEHAAALGALLNIIILGYQLSILAITSFAVRWAYLPLLWVLLTPLIHLASFLALRVRVRKDNKDKKDTDGWLSYIYGSIVAEITPCNKQQPKTLQWRGEEEGWYKFGRVLAWMLNFGIVLHIFLGTFTLSSLLFISAADAISIVGRFIASAVVSQLIFKYELSGIKKTTFIEDPVPASKDDATDDTQNEETEMGLISSEQEAEATDVMNPPSSERFQNRPYVAEYPNSNRLTPIPMRFNGSTNPTNPTNPINSTRRYPS